MALFITLKNGNLRQWHVGNLSADFRYLADQVVSVQADGDELEFLYDYFPNIPKTKGRVVAWGSPWAEFIAGNFPITNG